MYKSPQISKITFKISSLDIASRIAKENEFERCIGINKRMPKFHHSVIFSWDLVLSSTVYCAELVKNNRHRLAVEMEAAGFFGAINYYASQAKRYGLELKVDGLAIRGLSDYANDKDKSDLDKTVNWRSVAASNASIVTCDILDNLEDEHFK